jgi:hypothetical protein
MSTAIAKNLMAEMKLLGMFAAFDQSVSDATRDQTSLHRVPRYAAPGRMRLSARAQNRVSHQGGQVHAAPGVRGHRLHRQPIDQQSTDQGTLRHAVAR